MKKATTVVAAASAAMLLAGPVLAGSGHDKDVHWGYGGAGGPDKWANLKAEYSACGGNQQSPIDIQPTAARGAELTDIKFNWSNSSLSVLNNGHTIQANYDAGSSIEVNGGQFDLLQYHFHAPSEHALKGKLYDMEVHFVHKAKNGELAVVGVFFEEGEENSALKPVWSNIPKAGNTNKVADMKINAADLLPSDPSKYFHYMGSLTTPPCSEVVNWYVLAEPVEASKEQINAFSKVIHDNNRPVQPLNRRFVLTTE